MAHGPFSVGGILGVVVAVGKPYPLPPCFSASKPWFQDLQKGDTTQKNFESLVRGEKDLAEMRASKQAGLGQVAIDTFVNGFVQIVISVALDAVRLAQEWLLRAWVTAGLIVCDRPVRSGSAGALPGKRYCRTVVLPIVWTG